MAIPQSATILHHLRQTILRHENAGLTDGQLLRSFLYRRDEAAFEALVRRHGPMVRGVCRRVLRNLEDADDAFQAAFLVLIRKALTLTTREVIGDWLHGVAYRTALKARVAASRRRMKEKQALRQEAFFEQENRSEWLPLLDEEVGRLPPKYRLPVVLCDLEGRTRKEAAQHLGWPEGTVSGRLSRARAMLARRLTRRGVALSAVTLAASMAGEASARLPISVSRSICKAALECAAGSAVGSVPAHVAALSEGVVKAMFVSKLKNAVALVMVALVLTAGAGAWRYAAVAGQAEKQNEEKPIPVAPRDVRAAQLPKIPPLPKDRQFQIDLRLEREKDGQRRSLAAPTLLVPEQQEAGFGLPERHPISLGGSKMDDVGMGPSVRFTVRAYFEDKICLDMTVSQPTRRFFARDDTIVEAKSIRAIRKLALGEPTTVKLKTDGKDPSVLEVTAAVRLIEKETDPNTIAAAEKDYQMAEFWRRTGHPDSARFYYELIRRRYPNSLYDERAQKRLAELKEKPPARVGQIFITGNKKILDGDILEQLKLYPGQILTYPDLQIAERNLSRLKGLKSKPKVTVMDREGDGEFKDIEITVEEK
jgi:RNA polymerase sigma factor (sigma-70 family)